MKEPNLTQIMAQHSDERTEHMSLDLSNMMNAEWEVLQQALNSIRSSVLNVTFALPKEEVTAIMERYFEDAYKEHAKDWDIVCSVYLQHDGDDSEPKLQADLEYYYKETEYQPSVYVGQTERPAKMTTFQTMPSAVDVMKAAMDQDSATPMFEIEDAGMSAEMKQYVRFATGAFADEIQMNTDELASALSRASSETDCREPDEDECFHGSEAPTCDKGGHCATCSERCEAPKETHIE